MRFQQCYFTQAKLSSKTKVYRKMRKIKYTIKGLASSNTSIVHTKAHTWHPQVLWLSDHCQAYAVYWPLILFPAGGGLTLNVMWDITWSWSPIRPMIEGLHLLPHNMLQHNVSSILLNATVQAVEKKDCIYMLNITVQAAEKKRLHTYVKYNSTTVEKRLHT